MGACSLCRHDLTRPAATEPQLRAIRVPRAAFGALPPPMRASVSVAPPTAIAAVTATPQSIERSTQTELAESASRAVGAPGLFLDFTLASLTALDAWLESAWGVDPHDGAMGSLGDAPMETISAVSAYFGEVLVRRFAGRWADERRKNGTPPSTPVVFERGLVAWPTARVIERYRLGAARSLAPFANQIRDQLLGRAPPASENRIDANGWLAQAIAARVRGELDRASIPLDRALTLDPTLIEAWRERGELAELSGNREAALDAYRRAVALPPTPEELKTVAMLSSRMQTIESNPNAPLGVNLPPPRMSVLRSSTTSVRPDPFVSLAHERSNARSSHPPPASGALDLDLNAGARGAVGASWADDRSFAFDDGPVEGEKAPELTLGPIGGRASYGARYGEGIEPARPIAGVDAVAIDARPPAPIARPHVPDLAMPPPPNVALPSIVASAAPIASPAAVSAIAAISVARIVDASIGAPQIAQRTSDRAMTAEPASSTPAPAPPIAHAETASRVDPSTPRSWFGDSVDPHRDANMSAYALVAFGRGTVDFTPASLAVVDAYLDALPAPSKPSRDEISLTSAEEFTAWQLGCYLGEVACRALGGSWHIDQQQPRQSGVSFADGRGFSPFVWVSRKFVDRGSESIASRFAKLASRGVAASGAAPPVAEAQPRIVVRPSMQPDASPVLDTLQILGPVEATSDAAAIAAIAAIDAIDARVAAGDLLGALALANEAAFAKAASARALERRAELLTRLGRVQESLLALDDLTAHHPDHARGWLLRGRTLEAIQMFDRAIHSFHRATQLEPNLVDAWLRMGRGFLRYQRWDDARACFLEATKRNGDDPAGWIGYGDALLGLHRDADSLRAYDRATRCPRVEMTREIEPHHGHYARALVEERLGHSVEARTAFHKFLETAHADDPRAVDAQRRLASPPRASVPPKA